MKIIDKETGKRVGAKDAEVKKHSKKLKEEDPILRNADKDENLEEFSAMDPPSAYDKERMVGANYETMNPFFQELMDEHKEVVAKTNEFDTALINFKTSGYNFTEELSQAFNTFFVYFDDHILPHNRKEERHYFRILHDRLIEAGEHGNGEEPSTAVDIMIDDHVKFIQLAALTFNLLGLGTRLQDTDSKIMTFDLAFNTGRELSEMIRLHVFREDETLFPLSQDLLTAQDFEVINE
ncbi:MAG: hemerythrin domain-containing protein [Flavobacteriia bacterium]|nr:hemerythrin domain-containing protein [Flavobacteriia bacterium]